MQKHPYISKCFRLAEKLLTNLTKFRQDIIIETSTYDDVPVETISYELVQDYEFTKVMEMKILLSYIDAFIEIKRYFLNHPKSINAVIRTNQLGRVEYFINESGVEKPEHFVVNDESPTGGRRDVIIEPKALKFLQPLFTYESFERGEYINTGN